MRRCSGRTKPLLTCLIVPVESSKKVVGNVLTPHALATSGVSSILYAVSVNRSLPYSARIPSRIGLWLILHTEHPSDQKYTMVGLFDAVFNCCDARLDREICRRFMSNNITQANAIIANVINNRSYIACPDQTLTYIHALGGRAPGNVPLMGAYLNSPRIPSRFII
jgi:hypothetical protein